MNTVVKSKGLGTRMRERFKRSNEERRLWEPPEPGIPLHPGEILKRDYLGPHGITARELANAMHTRLTIVRNLLRGKRRVCADLAFRLGCCFDTTPEYWLSLQNTYSLAKVWAKKGADIEQQVVPFDYLLLAAISRERRGQPAVRVGLEELIAEVYRAG